MKIETQRFGTQEVNESEIISFPEGILGFEGENQFIVIDPSDSTLILWLQSIKSPEIAFPIIEPQLLDPASQVQLLPADLKSLSLESSTGATTYNILTIPADIKYISANLKAPVVINSKLKIGRQIVLQDSKLEVRAEIYNQLKTAIASAKSAASNDSYRTRFEAQNSQANNNVAAKNTQANNEKANPKEVRPSPSNENIAE
ncbi:MAG: flagellar assembly protein FliW [Halobacteriovoraceae bacterium]|nr:flagellar assembly protein FliW [Halobacteriovoraceae bacterium]